MNKVRELYAKYNLEGKSSSSTDFVHLAIWHGKKRIEAHQDRAMSILVAHFFVQVLSFKMFDPKTGDRHRAIELVGRRENVLMAEYVYHFLLQQIESLLDERVKKSGRALSRLERKSYRLGILEGFEEKLEQAERAQPAPSKSAETRADAKGHALTPIGQAVANFKRGRDLDDYLRPPICMSGPL